MVYKIYTEDSIDDRKSELKPKKSGARLELRHESLAAKVSLSIITVILFIYDLITYPIYYVLQRPDQRALEAKRCKSEQVDVQTWLKIPVRDLVQHKFKGTTVSEIFTNSVREFRLNPCLGYRALITCPLLTTTDEGQSVIQEKSFRSDYTWYTYEQICRRVQDIASGLYYHSVYPTCRCLFLADTCLEWFCASQACYQIGAQLVLAPEIQHDAALCQIINEAEVSLLFVTCNRLRQVCRLLGSIKSSLNYGQGLSTKCRLSKIIIIDWLFTVDFNEPAFGDLRDASEGLIDKILSLGQIEETGVEHPIELRCTEILCDNDPMALEGLLEKEYPNASPMLNSPNVLKRRKSMQLPESKLDDDDVSRSSAVKGGLKFWTHLPDIPILSIFSNDLKPEPAELGLRSRSRSSPRISIEDFRNEFRSDRSLEPCKPEDLAMIVYTYGSIDQLKAVMLTHSYLARRDQYLFHGESIHCATLDLDDVVEFMTEMAVICNGGSIGYSCSQKTLFFDGKDLFTRDKSDLESLNPTFLLLRPYQLERLRTSLHYYLQMNPFFSFLLVNLVCHYKKYWATRHFDTPIVNRLFCAPLKNLFGSRLKYILCNGVTDCAGTRDFFAFMVNTPVIELYGLAEAHICAISALDELYSQSQYLFKKNQTKDNRNLLITSSIFSPSFGTRVRLEDWEDFRHTDQPYPRGRLVLGGETVCKGYFRAGTLADRFYQDSNRVTWFKSDHLAQVFPNGSFEIISAMSDIIKMVDGQLISLSQIEHCLRDSQFVDNACAICIDDRKFVIVLVVPNLRRIALKSPNEANLKMAIGSEPEPDELGDLEFRREVCNDRLLCEFVTKHLTELITISGFQSIRCHFHLVPEIWTPENELVNPSFEPRRSAIQKYYASDILSLQGFCARTRKTRGLDKQKLHTRRNILLSNKR